MKRYRTCAVAAAVLIATAFAAVAETGTEEMDADVRASVDARIGNTIIATDADGTQTHIYWRADGSFAAWRADWKTEGSWFPRDGKLCLKYDLPRPGMGTEECLPPTLRRPGESWGTNGRSVTMVEGWQ